MTRREKIKVKELSNELNLTRVAAKIIKANLDKSPIGIGNLIVRAFDSQGVVIKVERELPELAFDQMIYTMRASEWELNEVVRREVAKAGFVATESLIKDSKGRA